MESNFTNENGITGSKVTVAGTIYGQILNSVDVKNNVVTVKNDANYVKALNEAGYATTINKKAGTATVTGTLAAKYSNGTTTKYIATLQDAITNCPKYYTVTLFEDYKGDLEVATKQKAATDGITIDLNGHTLTGNIIVKDESREGYADVFTLTLKNGTVDGKIIAEDNVTLTNVAVTGVVEATAGTLTLKADASVGGVKLTGNSTMKVTEGANIGGTAYAYNAETKTITGLDKIEAAAYVLNYQSKAVFGFYGNIETAVAATAKYYTLVLMKDIELTKPINTSAKATLKTNGFTIDSAMVGSNLTIK